MRSVAAEPVAPKQCERQEHRADDKSEVSGRYKQFDYMIGDEYRPQQKTCNRAQTNRDVYPCAALELHPECRNSVCQQQRDIQPQ